MRDSSAFIRIWKSGGVSLFIPHDRRAWPFCCAMALQSAQRYRMAGNEYMRNRLLRLAEYMAMRRKPVVERKLVGSWVHAIVDTCDVCGKRGVFLQGDAGRCHQHKAVPAASRVDAIRRSEQRCDAISKAIDDSSRLSKRIAHSRLQRKNMASGRQRS